MKNTQASQSKLLSRVGLAVSGLIVIAATSLPVATASAQALLVKFDGKDLELKHRNSGGEGNNNANSGRKIQQITIGKGDRDEEVAKPKKNGVPIIQIGKGDRDEEAPKIGTQQITIGKGDREEGSGKKVTPKVLIGKGDRDKNEVKVVKRQIIVEKAKPKKIVEAEPVVAKKKVVAAAELAVEQVVVADAEAPAVEVAPEAAPETPAEEQAVTEEAPAEVAAPAPAFKVGQIVTAGDGNSYVIVKVDATGISAMPLSAFTQYEEPAPVYQPVYKKRKHKRRYTTYRSNSYSCH